MEVETAYCNNDFIDEYDNPSLSQSSECAEQDISNETEVMSYSQTITYIERLIDYIRTEFGLSEASALKLLMEINWIRERIQDKITDELIFLPFKGLSQSNEQEFECIKCTIKGQIGNAYSLSCNHWFCHECFFDFLNGALREREFLKRCPIDECCEIVTGEHYRKYLDENASKEHDMLMFENFIATAENITLLKCQKNGCQIIIKSLRLSNTNTSQPITINCDCGYSFCSQCLETPHKNLTCQQYSEWIDERKNDDWIKRNTKNCPFCLIRVQKEGGSLYTSCSACAKEFCWKCLNEWIVHCQIEEREENCTENPSILTREQEEF